MSFYQITDTVKKLLLDNVKEKNISVDFTLGRGNDTIFLSENFNYVYSLIILQSLSPPNSNHLQFLIPYPDPSVHLHEGVLTPTTIQQHPARPPQSLGLQVSQGLGVSSLPESGPGSPPLYICWGLWTNKCMLPGCWLRV